MSLPNNLRLRPDLVLQPQGTSEGTWVVKDPISLRFFFFGADEYFILQRLDGQYSSKEIIEEFARERAPRRMTAERLQGFFSNLYRNGLACSDAREQGALLLEREAKQRWRESTLGWTNLLAIRLPGVNPDAWLDRLYPAIRWCFSWWILAFCLLSWIVAAVLAVVDYPVLASQWPRMAGFLSGENLIWLAIALAGTKILHELAHAFTCKHFGGRCHELGAMLLVFTPCLYCNVTDSWLLRSRWQRIAISVAGIAMELQLAAIALVLWRYTVPGPLHSICLNVVIVCSVGTLLFNGNPLLKYDGYYILSDLIRTPNLWQRSRACLSGLLSKLFLNRIAKHEEESTKSRYLLIIYALVSTVYRLVLTFTIFLCLYRWLHPGGYDLLLLIVAASVIVQTVFAWKAPLELWRRDPRQLHRIRKLPALIALALLISGIAFVIGYPLTCRVAAPVTLQASGIERVYVATPGILRQAVEVGEHLAEGETLAVLTNVELDNEILRIMGDMRRAASKVRTLVMRVDDEPTAAAELLVAEEILKDLKLQARLRDLERQALVLRAPKAGWVIQPPWRSDSSHNSIDLPAWTGSPLDEENLGCYLERGTLVCLVGDLSHGEAVALVDETDVAHIRIGQQARVQFALALDQIFVGKVVEIAEVKAKADPTELLAQQETAIQHGELSNQESGRASYQVRIEIKGSSPELLGARGKAKILVEPQTLAKRIARWASRTFTVSPVN